MADFVVVYTILIFFTSVCCFRFYCRFEFFVIRICFFFATVAETVTWLTRKTTDCPPRPRATGPAHSRGAASDVAQGDRREPWATSNHSSRRAASTPNGQSVQTPRWGLNVIKHLPPGLPPVALGYIRRRSAALCRHCHTRLGRTIQCFPYQPCTFLHTSAHESTS